MRSTKTAILAATLVLVGGGACAGIAGADPPAPPAPPPPPKTTMDHDGTYAVGTDIVPGTYVSPGPVEGGACYWKRMSAPNGDIIDNAMTKQPQVVRIDPSDMAFKTSGCQPWQQTDAVSPPGEAPPWLAQLQLRTYIDTLNAKAGQIGGGQLPPP